MEEMGWKFLKFNSATGTTTFKIIGKIQQLKPVVKEALENEVKGKVANAQPTSKPKECFVDFKIFNPSSIGDMSLDYENFASLRVACKEVAQKVVNYTKSSQKLDAYEKRVADGFGKQNMEDTFEALAKAIHKAGYKVQGAEEGKKSPFKWEDWKKIMIGE